MQRSSVPSQATPLRRHGQGALFDEFRVARESESRPTKNRRRMMGELVVTEFITLDGVIEDPGGSEGHDRGGWAFQFERGEDGDKFKLDELMTADAQLLGRRTYEGFAAAWPERTDEMGFAEQMNSMPKYVVSTTLDSADWHNTTILRDVGEVARIKDDH